MRLGLERASLVADQRAAVDKFQELQRKQELSEQNGELLQRKAGEQLEVLDPPSLPVTTTYLSIVAISSRPMPMSAMCRFQS